MDDELVASELIRDLRGRAGLTQAALASRAGVPRPVVSAYEHHHRQPSVAVLARMARAAGLRVQLVPRVDVTRNAARFADALTLVDAMPPRRRRREPLPHPVTWRR